MSVEISGHQAKLKNRRVFLGRIEGNDREFLVAFKKLVAAEGRADRVQVTKLRLSNEAAHALVGLYLDRYMEAL